MLWKDLASDDIQKWLDIRHKNAIQAEIEGFEWFSRVWTLQESVPAHATVLQLGKFQVPWGAAVGLLAHWGDDTVSGIEDLRHKKGRLTLLELLNQTWTRRSTEPRDKIYGIVGLCSAETRTICQADHSPSDRESKLQVTSAFALEQQSLSFLKLLDQRIPSFTVHHDHRVQKIYLFTVDTALRCFYRRYGISPDVTSARQKTDWEAKVERDEEEVRYWDAIKGDQRTHRQHFGVRMFGRYPNEGAIQMLDLARNVAYRPQMAFPPQITLSSEKATQFRNAPTDIRVIDGSIAFTGTAIGLVVGDAHQRHWFVKNLPSCLRTQNLTSISLEQFKRGR